MVQVRIPPAARRALRRRILSAVSRLDPLRYSQEPSYVAALFARLDDVVYRGHGLTIELQSTIVDDRGRGSAESKWGADFAIVARIRASHEDTEKGALGQAKKGSLVDLPPSDAERFREQIVNMGRATQAMLGLEVPTQSGDIPVIRIVEVSPQYGATWAAQSLLSNRWYEKTLFASNSPEAPPVLVGKRMGLDHYLDRELIRCLHGDDRPEFVQALGHSSLKLLRVNVMGTG
jgi:hypothetical protein